MRIFCFILTCLSPYLCLAQTDSIYRAILALPLDSSKVIKLNDLAWSLAMQAPDKAMTYAEEALGLAEGIAYPAGQANAYYLIASAFLQTGHPDDALDNYTRSLQICKKYDLRSLKGDVLRGMGSYFQATGDKEMARHYVIESAGIAIEQADFFREAKCYLSLGALTENRERLSYQLRAAKLLENITNQKSNNILLMTTQIVAYQNISNYYRSINKIDSAFIYIEKAEKINEVVNNKYTYLGIKVT